MKIFIMHIIEILIIFIITFGIYLMKLLKREILIETLDGIKDIVVKLLVGIVLVYYVYAGVFPAMRDIPNIIQKNIYTIEGIAQKDCEPPKFNRMLVPVEDEETKEVQCITFFMEIP